MAVISGYGVDELGNLKPISFCKAMFGLIRIDNVNIPTRSMEVLIWETIKTTRN